MHDHDPAFARFTIRRKVPQMNGAARPQAGSQDDESDLDRGEHLHSIADGTVDDVALLLAHPVSNLQCICLPALGGTAANGPALAFGARVPQLVAFHADAMPHTLAVQAGIRVGSLRHVSLGPAAAGLAAIAGWGTALGRTRGAPVVPHALIEWLSDPETWRDGETPGTMLEQASRSGSNRALGPQQATALGAWGGIGASGVILAGCDPGRGDAWSGLTCAPGLISME